MLIWAMFRYMRPDEIQLDYLNLLLTPNGYSFMQAYLCPCG